jgi:hypothetical protein
MGSIPNREKQGYKIDNAALSLFKHAVLINKIKKLIGCIKDDISDMSAHGLLCK